MTFEELLDQVLDMLQHRGRVSYRAVQRQFALDDATLKDVKAELLYAHPEQVADDGRGLVWSGGVVAPALPAPAPVVGQTWQPDPTPLAYTPPHRQDPRRPRRPGG